jgi:metal-dependent amidase/aminoacylase/carboxypeptidase family protein
VCDFVRPAAPIKSAISGVRVGHLCPHGGVEAVSIGFATTRDGTLSLPLLLLMTVTPRGAL